MSGRYKRKRYMWIYLFLLPSILVFLIFYLYPIVTLFVTSFTSWDGFNQPSFVGISNFENLFKQSVFFTSLGNILLWSLIAVTLHVFLGTLVALILYKRPVGWRFVRTVYMIPNVIAMAAWAIIYKFVFNNEIGILNGIIRIFNSEFEVKWFFQSPYAFWAITFTWLFYAVIVTLIVLGDLMAIPPDLHEAARLDGASEWQITRMINLPLCRNAIGTGMILSITSRISMYENIRLTTGGGPGDDTMSLPLMLVSAIADNRYGYANAIALIMLILGVLTLIIINKTMRMDENIY